MTISSMKISKSKIMAYGLIALLVFFIGSVPAAASSDDGHAKNLDEFKLSSELAAPEAKTPVIDQSANSSDAPGTNSLQVASFNQTPNATKLESVYALRNDQGVKIKLIADGSIKNFQKFTAEDPARIVFDLYHINQPHKREQLVPVNSEWVKNIRYFSHPDKVRLVIDTKKDYLAAYTATPVQNGLLIQVGKTALISESEKPAGEQPLLPQKTADSNASPVLAAKPLLIAKTEAPDSAKPAEVKPDNQPAWVNRIDFSSEEAGKSTIIIGTTKPVKYDLIKVAENRLQLKLMDTRLPDYRKRPLVTTRFESAIDRILPFETPAAKNAALFSIELRQAVPYYVEQADNLIMVHFEASTVAPKPLEKADLPSWRKVVSQPVVVAHEATVTESGAAMPAGPTAAAGQTDMTGIYTGEKIALDFYETDIKNVFRILREVSKKNFAIDRGVSGKVTLTLEKPVPWDQVLDLILKMNGLGMTMEGDIIRIAKKATIDKEEAELKKK